ncbi:hypothetical protein [Corynebacterium frankenforstense]|uniref:hypothetical protein n=1 Tax=Corynebacterium frankenforstense TaxID=1230998 RepID=UPI0012EC3737|nr:hypothetical protein [Corynebacterium frankenforstense]
MQLTAPRVSPGERAAIADPRAWRPGPVPPYRAWWLLAGLLALTLIVPFVLDLVLPEADADDEVVLSAEGFDWELPVEDPATGETMICAADMESLSGAAYNCGGARIDALAAEGYRDADRSVRRAMRALSQAAVSDFADVEVHWDGRVGVAVSPEEPVIGVAMIDPDARGGGAGADDPDPMLVAVVEGDDAARLVAPVWRALGGGEIPAEARALLSTAGRPEVGRGGEDAGQPGRPDRSEVPDIPDLSDHWGSFYDAAGAGVRHAGVNRAGVNRAGTAAVAGEVRA